MNTQQVCKHTLIAVLLTVAAVGISVMAIVSSLGGFNRVDTVHDQSCKVVGGFWGAEDLAIDYATGIAYASADNRWAHAGNVNERGKILQIDLNQSPPVATEMQGTEALQTFHPHGISLFSKGDEQRLFVIHHHKPSHPAEGHSVLIFRIQGSNLTLLETIEHPGIRSPNDLVAVGDREFYFTNDRGALEGIGMILEVLLGLNNSDISYFDGTGVRTVAKGLAFANGIAANSDLSEIYATALRSSDLNIYHSDPHTRALTLKQRISLGSGPDNISVDQQGQLWIADHANGLDQLKHSSNPEQLSAARIFRVDPASGSTALVYEDNGSNMSSVSVAAPYRDKLMMGSVFEEGMLLCDRSD